MFDMKTAQKKNNNNNNQQLIHSFQQITIQPKKLPKQKSNESSKIKTEYI